MACATLSTVSGAHAQQVPGVALKEMVVTATRVEQSLTDVVADVSVIDRDTIERSGAVALADVLVRVPGLSMARNGGLASTTSVFVRGAESRFTAVFVDGVRIDSQSTGGASWQNIPLSQVERIEVVRGPAAAVYGSDALGGVIQIFTRKGEAGFTPSLGLGVGTHGTWRLDTHLSGATEAVDYSIGITRELSDGFNTKPTGSQPDRDGYRATSASARLGWALNEAHRLELTAISSDSTARYDSGGTADDETVSDMQALGVSWSAKWDDVYRSKLSVGQSTDRYETRPSPYVTKTELNNYLWHNEWRWVGQSVSADLERREDRLLNASTVPVRTRRSVDALALGYGLNVQAHTLQLNVRHDDDSEFGGETTGSAAYAYRLSPQWRVTAAAGTAFRTPTLFQRFSIYGVPTLQAESARNVEAGLKYQQPGTSWGVVVFRNQVKNLITYVSGAGACINGTGSYPGCYGNTARALYQGLTLSGQQQVGAVELRASLDWLDPQDRDTGKQLARRAKRQALLGADSRWAGWTLGVETQWVAQRFDNASNTKRLPGYALLNLAASTSLAPEWILQLRLNNALDKAYQTALGYATEGRTLYAGVRWAPR